MHIYKTNIRYIYLIDVAIMTKRVINTIMPKKKKEYQKVIITTKVVEKDCEINSIAPLIKQLTIQN